MNSNQTLKEFIKACLTEGDKEHHIVKQARRKYYHASPKKFKNGDILTGNHEGGGGYRSTNVCMTTSPDPHRTIADQIPGWSGYRGHHDDRYLMDAPEWYVYEVEPLYEPGYVHGNSEYQTKAAKVLRRVGKASAFLEKRKEGSIALPKRGKKAQWNTRFHGAAHDVNITNTNLLRKPT